MSDKIATLLTIFCATLILQGCERHAQSSEVAVLPTSKGNGVAGGNTDVVVLNAKAAEVSGIKSSLIVSEPGTAQIKTTGEVKAAEPNVFHISCLVTGRVV